MAGARADACLVNNIRLYSVESWALEYLHISNDVCLSDFAVAVKRQHDQDDLKKKELIVVYSFRGSESMTTMAGSLQA